MPMESHVFRYFLYSLICVFRKYCRLVAIATICALTNVYEAHRKTHELFLGEFRYVAQAVKIDENAHGTAYIPWIFGINYVLQNFLFGCHRKDSCQN